MTYASWRELANITLRACKSIASAPSPHHEHTLTLHLELSHENAQFRRRQERQDLGR
jgi:hypothetical protein